MPVSVEITYGLERIIMLLQVSHVPPAVLLCILPPQSFLREAHLNSLQGVDHFKKIQYADGITYGELFLENE